MRDVSTLATSKEFWSLQLRTSFLLSRLTLLIGCDDTASDKAGDTDSTDEAFAPTAGQWSWQGTTYSTAAPSVNPLQRPHAQGVGV